MPTWQKLPRFVRDWAKLSAAEQALFMAAVALFREDLRKGDGFRKSLRVKKMQGHDGVWEMSWAPDGRATFSYGAEVRQGERHVVWRRIGSHGIFNEP